MKKLILYLLLLCVMGLLHCQNSKQTYDTQIQKEGIYQDFVEAVNTGDSSKVKTQIVKHWSDTLIGPNNQWLSTDMNYWLAFNKEFGPLEYVSFGRDTFNSNKVAWFKGQITKDWVGLEFDFNPQNQITGTNVLRSCTPSEASISGKGESMGQKELKTYFDRMQEANLFSGMVLVAKGNKIIYEGFHGFANKESKKRITADNKMVIASTTKMFTAVAIAQLVQAQKIELDRPISHYLNDFPKEIGDKVTTTHLLTHTSGIELDELDGFMEEIELAKDIDEFYKINLNYLPKLDNYQSFSTLESMDYSNENFDIMGKLIEVIAGQDFYSYLEEHIFQPLGMKNTAPIDRSKLNTFITKNYQLDRSGRADYDDGFRQSVPHSNLAMSRPAGSFYSTPQDLYIFMKALNKGDLINKELKQEFTSKKVDVLQLPIYKAGYGYGFYVNERYSLRNYGHAGGMPGVSSRCEYYPEYDIYVIVTSNYNGSANLAANYISSVIPFLRN
ncbi:MAG: serine hydrolase domain-containing protein [Bacteroidota bacterium]